MHMISVKGPSTNYVNKKHISSPILSLLLHRIHFVDPAHAHVKISFFAPITKINKLKSSISHLFYHCMY